MSELVWSDEIPTQFGLISVRDSGTEYHPSVVTGEEFVVATPGHIFVASQTDTDGDVKVEIRIGEPDIPGLRSVFDGIMRFESSSLCVVAPTEPNEVAVSLPLPGDWGVKIYTEGDPAHFIAIFLDSAKWVEGLRK